MRLQQYWCVVVVVVVKGIQGRFLLIRVPDY